jgi:hypothetical protein
MTERSGPGGGDPIADFQRWLMRTSARGLGSQLKDQARRTFGGGSSRGDVWETATAEPVPGEAPECAWCPVCRAARRLRDSGPGLASHVAGAGDALLSVAQDTLAAFEATLAARPPETSHRPPEAGSRRPSETGSHRPPQTSRKPPEPGSRRPSETESRRPPEAVPDEPDDRH